MKQLGALNNISICIPTYNRFINLKELVADLTKQTKLPDTLIIVDSNPESLTVKKWLEKESKNYPWKSIYIPSFHKNLPYQRLLGWRVAKINSSDVIIYLDDDLRIKGSSTIECLIKPVITESKIVASTTTIKFINQSFNNVFQNQAEITDLRSSNSNFLLVKWLGGSKRLMPGQVTAYGQKKSPEPTGNEYDDVEWLHGGVMAVKMAALDEDSFSIDMMAMYERRIGKGEDTILSRMISKKGKLVHVWNEEIEHPANNTPQAYPVDAFNLGKAIAYSRRLINDHFRKNQKPTLGDRLALLRTYLGSILINNYRIFRKPNYNRVIYSLGYMVGALSGVFIKPTSDKLTPMIDWWDDAEKALERVEVIQGAQPDGR